MCDLCSAMATEGTEAPRALIPPCNDAAGSKDKQPRPADRGALPTAAKHVSKNTLVDVQGCYAFTQRNKVT